MLEDDVVVDRTQLASVTGLLVDSTGLMGQRIPMDRRHPFGLEVRNLHVRLFDVPG